MGCSGQLVRTACCSGLLSLQSRRVLALFVYNCPECLSCRNHSKAIETSKLVEPQLLRPRSPTEQFIRLVCRGLPSKGPVKHIGIYSNAIWSTSNSHLNHCYHKRFDVFLRLFLFLKDMNPFCLSANDMDMVLLVSRPGPPPLDVSKGRCNAPFLLCAFTSFKYSIWEP